MAEIEKGQECTVNVSTSSNMIDLRRQCDIDSDRVLVTLCQKIGTIWIELFQTEVSCATRLFASRQYTPVIGASGRVLPGLGRKL